MAEGTKIEWTYRPNTIPATLNALVGCQKISAGCKNCYAIEVANIRAGNPLPIMQEKFAGTVKTEGGKRVWTGKVTLTEKALLDPLRRKKPRTYFVNALSDLFYEGVPDEWVDKHFAVFALCPQHTFIVLTKRPERMRMYMSGRWGDRVAGILVDGLSDETFTKDQFEAKENRLTEPLPNVWLGTSVEDQETANVRIPELLQTPAAVRFISAEPLLGAVDLTAIRFEPGGSGGPVYVDALRGTFCSVGGSGYPAWGKLDQVIVGGESGPGARPCNVDHISSIVDQCASAKVPAFVKQLGSRIALGPFKDFEDQLERMKSWAGIPVRKFDGAIGSDPDVDTRGVVFSLSNAKGGDWNEWPQPLRVRQFPEVA